MIAHRTLRAALDEVNSPHCLVLCVCKREFATIHHNGTVICAANIGWNTPLGRDVRDAAAAGGHLERDGYEVELESGEHAWEWGWGIVPLGEPLARSVECPHCHRSIDDVNWPALRAQARIKKNITIAPQRSRPL